MKAKILSMLLLQDSMNQKVHPKWDKQGFNWTRAIMVESVEALEHYGWKWWKKQEPDIAQFHIELVDIWHFIMSKFLQNSEITDVADYFADSFERGAPHYMLESDVRTNLELLIGRAAGREVYLAPFLALMAQTNLSFDELYTMYVAKNVLNIFRQDHGYKDGTYIKMWGGREDNVVLAEFLKFNPNVTTLELRASLERVYQEVLKDWATV